MPGSFLEARIDNTQPLAWGMDDHAYVFYDESPAFRLQPDAALKNVRPIAWYESPTPLRSGWAWGQQYLDQAVSIIEAPVGKGHVVLFGNEVNWRAQPHGTFKLLFNGIYYGSASSPATAVEDERSTIGVQGMFLSGRTALVSIVSLVWIQSFSVGRLYKIVSGERYHACTSPLHDCRSQHTTTLGFDRRHPVPDD